MTMPKADKVEIGREKGLCPMETSDKRAPSNAPVSGALTSTERFRAVLLSVFNQSLLNSNHWMVCIMSNLKVGESHARMRRPAYYVR